MNASRMPPYWIGWYDRWNLALPVAFAAVLAWVLTLPRPVAPMVAAPPTPVRPALPPLQPTTLESPANGARWRTDHGIDVLGRAHPGATVVLAYSTAPSLDRRELGRIRAADDGRYGFRISRFPAGQHVFQVTAWTIDGRMSASPPVDVWVTDAPSAPQDQRRRRAGPKK